MSEVKVNKISPRSGTEVTLGDSGDTFTIPSGATINNQGTATNFGATGSASWNTTVKTSDFTAVAGEGYFVNTTSGEVDVTLPAGTAVAVVAVADYANTADTNNIILKQNGSDKIEGSTNDYIINREGASITLVYVDSTKGWIVTDTGNSTDAFDVKYIVASGGTESTSGNFKIHTFTGPGTFTITCIGSACGSNSVDYLVVAGGGSGGGRYGGGGGGGGYRESSGAASGCYTRSPLGACVSALTLPATSYPITVGAGGAGVPAVPGNDAGNRGSNSVFSTITSAGGGVGQGQNTVSPLAPGGSGGGGSYGNSAPIAAGGSGNTPSVSPPQGSNGGNGHSPNAPYATGGGGGATEVGANATPSPSTAGRGGAGATSCITGLPVGRSGGGGGSGEAASGPVNAGAASPCGSGTAGAGSNTNAASAAANRGGGSGAAYYPGPSSNSGVGGSGIVVIRYKFQN